MDIQYFGDGQSAFYDVYALNDTLAYAVGDIEREIRRVLSGISTTLPVGTAGRGPSRKFIGTAGVIR